MNAILIKKLILLKKYFYELEKLLKLPNIISNNKNFQSLSSKYSFISEIITNFEYWMNIQKKINHTKEMLTDIDMKNIVQNELEELNTDKKNIEKKIKISLLPKDLHDQYGCLMELRAGTGGKEAAIFAGELYRMYARYMEMKKWNVKIIHSTYGEYGGYKEIITKITNNGSYGILKFESGGHRVQRVPHTESQGRIHTSTCTVAVIPEVPDTMLPEIHPNDLKIDAFRSSGAGGQHVNTTDSAIRITHIPSGLSVECQDERSQHRNKNKALSVLKSRLYAINMKKKQKKDSDIRRNLIGTGDRSDRIRTYNFQQNRVTDHRISFTSYKLNDIMNGKLDVLIEPIMYKRYTDLLDQLMKSK